MSKLLEQVGQSIATRKLFNRNRRILVAVSGGVDSMALLHLLHALAPGRCWRLRVAHFNHQLRGRHSDADERFVRLAAKNLGLPFAAGRADVRKFARAKKISIEMAARRLRHDFLARTAGRLKISMIALAHHADDQVELFFLRLLRGGGEGLAGMKWISRSPAIETGNPKVELQLVRPLLGVNKADLEAFARENKIRFREDASNASLEFQRNRIRRELLPVLRRRYSPALDRVVLRAMEIIGEESELVGKMARDWLKRRGLAKLVLPKSGFADLPVGLQRRVLQLQLPEHGVAPEFDLIERLREKPDVPVAVSPDLTVWRDATGKLRAKQPARSAGLRPGSKREFLSCRIGNLRSGKVIVSGTEICWNIERLKSFRRPKFAKGRESFDAGEVGARIVLRHWRAGDRFQPIGMKSPVKLQDLFVNAKIPRERRGRLILATTGNNEIFWVEGLRIGEKFKLKEGTKRLLLWKWQACR